MSKACILIVFLVINLVLAHQVGAQAPTKPNYFAEGCQGEDFGNYTTNSIYQSNLNELLSGLKEKASTVSFYNNSAGSTTDKVYGQYYCRGDIDTKLCSDCIHEAAETVLMNCSNAKAAVVWYEECTLHYANQSTVGIALSYPFKYHGSSISDIDQDKFNAVLNNTMEKIFDEAAYKNRSLHFATGEGIVSQSKTLYCLVQCSPYLNEMQCAECLHLDKAAAEICCSQWAQSLSLFHLSCQIRYSVEGPFYELEPNAPTPVLVPSPPVGFTPPAKDAGRDTTYYVVRAVVPAAIVGLLLVLGISFFLIKRNRVLSSSSKRQTAKNIPTTEDGPDEAELQTTECLQFDLKTIEAATNSFSMSNILGQGGFGIVYQGILEDGQDIAVKRLSKNSGQGTKEFKTEVAVVAKLQHRNLVRLVGCCADGEERLLIYDFLRNLSLDRFLFDVTRSTFLTWATRHKIIQGIARGLHYLHEDSRVKIVHRDLKINNILLDDKLEPKIADFGMAKLVMVDQTAGNTTKVVGTYGYMAPEYALAGRYSTKSDVYSFGVIVLEILSGKSNSRFYDISHSEDLLSSAWRVWNEGAIEQIMDPILQNSYSRIEAERCLQIGLLCVQDDDASRPTMHAVLVMLNSNTVDLPPPFSPSHSSYINKLSTGDETKGQNNQQENESRSSITLSSANFYGR